MSHFWEFQSEPAAFEAHGVVFAFLWGGDSIYHVLSCGQFQKAWFFHLIELQMMFFFSLFAFSLSDRWIFRLNDICHSSSHRRRWFHELASLGYLVQRRFCWSTNLKKETHIVFRRSFFESERRRSSSRQILRKSGGGGKGYWLMICFFFQFCLDSGWWMMDGRSVVFSYLAIAGTKRKHLIWQARRDISVISSFWDSFVHTHIHTNESPSQRQHRIL